MWKHKDATWGSPSSMFSNLRVSLSRIGKEKYNLCPDPLRLNPRSPHLKQADPRPWLCAPSPFSLFLLTLVV